MNQETFAKGAVDTYFIDEHPELFNFRHSQNRAQKLLSYLGELQVNGPLTPLVTDLKPKNVIPPVPQTPTSKLGFCKQTSQYYLEHTAPSGFRDILLKDGPAKFAKAVRDHKGALLTDTTFSRF